MRANSQKKTRHFTSQSRNFFQIPSSISKQRTFLQRNYSPRHERTRGAAARRVTETRARSRARFRPRWPTAPPLARGGAHHRLSASEPLHGDGAKAKRTTRSIHQRKGGGKERDAFETQQETEQSFAPPGPMDPRIRDSGDAQAPEEPSELALPRGGEETEETHRLLGSEAVARAWRGGRGGSRSN